MSPGVSALCRSAALPPLSLRKEAATDLDAVREAYVSMRKEEFGSIDWPGETKDALLRSQFHSCRTQYARSYPDMVRLLFCCSDTIAGWAAVAELPGSLRLVDLALLPPWRGCGTGTYFLNALTTYAAQHKQSVQLSVFQGSPAARLYMRLGFQYLSGNGIYAEMRHSGEQSRNV